jgi:hypothetical protein
MGRKGICERGCGEIMKREFQVGEIVKFYGDKIFKERKANELIEEFVKGKRTKITKKDMVSPIFKIVIITKKANFDWNKYNSIIYALQDADGHDYLNPYGDVLLHKANKKEIKKFIEKWVANQI